MNTVITVVPRRLGFIAGFLLFGLTISCATTHHYVAKNISNSVYMQDSAAHAFTYVYLSDDDGQLVLYGKIDHRHFACASEGHVDVAVLANDGPPAYATSIPIVRRSSRTPGWHGAAFRARLPIRIPEGHSVHLVFHDDQCVLSETFDCQENQALSGANGR